MKVPVINAGMAKAFASVAPSEVMALLDESGAVLLRGFQNDLKSFEAFSQRFCDDFHNVSIRKAYREEEGDRRTSQVPPQNITIFSHTESSFKPFFRTPPEMCFFMCVSAPSEPGGETTLLDGVEFLKCLPAALRRRFEECGVTYEMRWGPSRWQAEYGMDDIHELAAALSAIAGVKATADGDEIHIFFTKPAITRSRGGQDVFAQGILAHLPRIAHPRYVDKNVHANPANHVYFGEGEELSDVDANTLIDIQDSLHHPHAWQGGDMLVIDNTRCLHGRTMTRNACERTLVSRFGRVKAAV